MSRTHECVLERVVEGVAGERGAARVGHALDGGF